MPRNTSVLFGLGPLIGLVVSAAEGAAQSMPVTRGTRVRVTAYGALAVGTSDEPFDADWLTAYVAVFATPLALLGGLIGAPTGGEKWKAVHDPFPVEVGVLPQAEDGVRLVAVHRF